MGLEPTTLGTTIQCSNQLSYIHHIRLKRILLKRRRKDRHYFRLRKLLRRFLSPVLLINGFLARQQGISHQGNNRHRPYSTGNRRDIRAFRRHLVELDIAHQLITALRHAAGHTRRTDIDHHGTLFHHIPFQELRHSQRDDDDIRRQAHLLPVLGAAVANRHRAITRISLLHPQRSHRLADDVDDAEGLSG